MVFEIREGRVDDIPAVFSLVRELAVYERSPDAVVTTPEEYVELMKEELFKIFVAEVEGEVVGMALYYYTFSTWKGKMLYLEDFVVRQKFRRAGIGHALFEKVIEEARQNQCALMKWQVLDWNQPAISFYEKYNVEFDKGWWNGKLFFRD